jgi:citrate lyase subunit beta / citryl-CoA lyase
MWPTCGSGESLPEAPSIRSYLYAPGSNPAVMDKALGAGADAVVLDLEDAVAPSAKQTARREVAALISSRAAGPPEAELHVRINRGPAGPDRDDLAAVTLPGLTGLRVPKVGAAEELHQLAGWLDELEAAAGMVQGAVRVYPVFETAAAVLAAREIAAAPRVARLAFGGTDFLADIGAPGAVDGPATLAARGALVLASRAAGIAAPVDTVYTNIDDNEGLMRGARFARELGFFGKSIIHPRQIAPVHEVFTPSEGDLAAARRVLAQAERAAERGEGASAIDGELVDPAVVARARRVLELAGESRA